MYPVERCHRLARVVPLTVACSSASCLAPDRSARPPGGAAEGPPEISTSTPFVGNKFSWPPGKKAAVSLTYDDALTSQLDNAAPALAGHHLRATFFITEGARNDPDR